MRYLLDTATWANGLTIPTVLPVRIRALLENDPENKGLCSVSLIECATHHRRGRLNFAGPLSEFFALGLARNIELLELTAEIAVAGNDLPRDFEGDPFDRAIAATARVLELTLITADRNIRDAKGPDGHPFCRVEFYPFRPSRL